MSRRTALPDLPAGLVAGVLTIDVAAAAVAGEAVPAWIKIAPRGQVRTRDDRVFAFDPDVFVAQMKADTTRIAVDVGHALMRDAATPAIGWIEEIEARPDGAYGRVDWLEGGKAVLKARTHRYVSPSFNHDDAKNAIWLHSVSLVATPALSNMPALASVELSQPETTMKSVAAALNLQESASETAILAALTSLKATMVPKADHDAVVAQLSAATTELSDLKKASHDAEVERELEDALKAGKITPAQKPALLAMAADTAGRGRLTALLAATADGAFTPRSGLDAVPTPTGGATAKSAATLSAEATKLAAERGISFTDALAIVAHTKAA